MIPTLGRIVHYVLPEGAKNKGGHRAATITGVYLDAEGKHTEASAVTLRVMLQPREVRGSAFNGPEGFIDVDDCFQDVTCSKGGTWHEPERLEAPRPIPEPVTTTAGAEAKGKK